MIDLKVDSRKLLKYTSFLDNQPNKNKTSIARALNQVGDGVVREFSQTLSKETGIPAERIRQFISVTHATPGSHRYEIVLKKGLAGEPSSQQPTASRDVFAAGTLVNVITAGDDRVCMVCERIAEEGPYTIEDARTLIPAHGGPDHNCRCQLVPYVSLKKLELQTSAGSSTRMTLKQLARTLQEEVQMSLRVSK